MANKLTVFGKTPPKLILSTFHRLSVLARSVTREHKGIAATFSTLWFLLTFLSAFHVWQRVRRKFPTGPCGLPVLGILPYLLAVENPGNKVKNLALRYGSVFGAWLGSYHVVFLNCPQLMKKSARLCDQSKLKDINHPQLFENINCGAALPTCNLSSNWRSLRRTVYNVLHLLASDYPKAFAEINVTNEVKFLIEEIDKNVGKSIDPLSVLIPSVPNILIASIFGSRFEYNDPDFHKFLQFCRGLLQLDISKNINSSMPKLIHSFAPVIPGAPFRDWRLMVKYVSKELNMERDDISHAVDNFLTGIEKQNPEALDSPFTMNLLISMAIVEICEGSETTVAGLNWLWLYMIKYPHIQKNIQRELDDVIGRERLPQLSDIPNLPYTSSVMLEGLRHPPLAFLSMPHETLDDLLVDGFAIPSGTPVFHNLWAILHNSQRFPLPHKFNPDRFLRTRNEFVEDYIVKSLQFGSDNIHDSMSLANMTRFMFFTSVLHQFNLTSNKDHDNIYLKGMNGLIRFPEPFQLIFNKRDR